MLYSCPRCKVTFSTQPSPLLSLIAKYLLLKAPGANNVGSSALTKPSEDENTPAEALPPKFLDMEAADSHNPL